LMQATRGSETCGTRSDDDHIRHGRGRGRIHALSNQRENGRHRSDVARFIAARRFAGLTCPASLLLLPTPSVTGTRPPFRRW
jgi:hypothetical protein